MRKLVAALLFAATAVGSVSADEQFDVRIDTRVGYGGLFKPGRWTPVTLTVQNLGPDIFGNLTISLKRRDRMGPDQRTNSFERHLDLSTGAVKSFSLVMPLETGVFPLQIGIRNGPDLVIEREVRLSGRGSTASLVAVLSRRTSLDFLLPVFNSRTDRALDIVYPLIEHLPDEWYGYDGVDLLVVHDARLQDLTGEQIDAVRDWVAAGGSLVVSAGAHSGFADSRVLAQLSGRVAAGLQVVPVEETGLREAGLPVVAEEALEPVVVSLFQDRPATVSAERIGRGRLVVLPFDYTQLVRVAPVTSLGLWTSLLPRAAVLNTEGEGGGLSRPGREGLVPIMVSRRVFETDVLANQMDLPLYRFPNRLLVAGLVASFVVAAVAILTWISRRPKPVHAWLGTFVLVAVAAFTAAIGHLTLTVGQQPPEALAFTLETARMAPDDGHALVTRDVVLFSRQRADYRIEFPDNGVLVPLQSRDHTVRLAGTTRYQDLQADRWGYVNAQVIQVAELDVHASIRRGIGYVSVEIRNSSPMAIDGVVVLNDGFPEEVGRIMPGTTVEHVVMGSGVGRWDEVAWARFVPDGELSHHRAQFIRDIARTQRDQKPSALSVVGWLSEPLVQANVTPQFERRVDLSALIITEEIASADGGEI